ncbi:DoxX family membrane protein [Chitinophaga solisilvae]|uniref:DoxX family membrane protein n=1 Tax=Chitinophaga solisilvae TaxID=1233460 RepID=UPI001369234A|nr:DoxX family membrane protein [Chitinophaga solisilvae]
MQNNAIAFVLLRLAIAASMLGHGLVRLSKLNGFSAWMAKNFEKSILPDLLVIPFSYVLPIAEFVIGLLLVLGLYTRIALIGGGIVMVLLIFGTAMIENWEALPSQLIHTAFFGILLAFIQYNSFAVDNMIIK